MPDHSCQITIREASPEDAVRCGDIAVAAWEPVFACFLDMVGAELFELQFPAWQAEKRRQVENHIGEYPHLAIVTVLEGQVVGFLTYRLFADKKTSEICNNAVDPEHQGKGIGTRQCERALEIFRNAGMAAAAVNTGLDPAHAPARAMYEKVGFGVSTPQIRYYIKL